MHKDNLAELADQHLARARETPAARSAVTLTRQDGLRQTLIALAAGAALDEHEAPGAATLLVVKGRAALTWLDRSLELGEGDLAGIPPHRHALRALEDTGVLLTVAAG